MLLAVGTIASAVWYQGEMARQEAERDRQELKQALDREYLYKQAFVAGPDGPEAALPDAENRLKILMNKLAKQSTVNELLSDVNLWHHELLEAQAPFLRTKALAAGNPEMVEEAFTNRLRNLKASWARAKKGWDFAKAFDEVRLAAGRVVAGDTSIEAAAGLYPDIFAGAGLESAGKCRRDCRSNHEVANALVYLAALDHWADVEEKKPQRRAHLFAIANRVDPDPWRSEFRNVQVWAGEKKLQLLLDNFDFREQSPSILVALARRPSTKSGHGALLLRKALADHPPTSGSFCTRHHAERPRGTGGLLPGSLGDPSLGWCCP